MYEQMTRIEPFLANNGQILSTITKSRVNQLKKVDKAIQNRLEAITTAKDTLSNSSINISSISVDTEISRKTFYNNELLKLYVESHADDYSDKTVTLSDYDKLKERYDLLNDQVQGFVSRDINIADMRHEKSELNKEIINLSKRNESLEKEYEKLQNELSNTKRKLAERSVNVIDISDRLK